MMNKNAAILPILLVANILFGQKYPADKSFSKEIIGFNRSQNKPIEAKTFEFDDEINQIDIDSVNGIVSIQLRGISKNGKWLNNKGNIQALDYRQNKIIWKQPINYLTDKIDLYGTILIQQSAFECTRINPMSKKDFWQKTRKLVYFDRKSSSFMAYRSKRITDENRNILESFDAETGVQNWERDIPHKYGWTDTHRISDTSMAIISSGLHLLNPKTGSGWSYKAKTGDVVGPNTGELVALNALGIGLGILTGTFFFSGGNTQLVGNLHSNLLVSDTSFIFASRENLVLLNKKTGAVNNILMFEKDNVASKSIVFEKNNLIYMVNQGFGLTAQGAIKYGKPFLLAFNPKTGLQKYLNFLPKKEIIYDVIFKNELIICLNEKKITQYSAADGKTISEQLPVEMNLLNNASKFTSNGIFIQSADSTFSPIIDAYRDDICVQTSTQNTLVLTNNLEVKTEIYGDKYFNYIGRYKNCKILVSTNKLIIIDDKGQIVSSIDDYYKLPKIKDNLLFVILRGKAKIAIVDLNDVFR